MNEQSRFEAVHRGGGISVVGVDNSSACDQREVNSLDTSLRNTDTAVSSEKLAAPIHEWIASVE